MATPNEPRREHPSTYFVQDRSSEEEMNRLCVQDQLITTAMGGVLPEQLDPSLFRPFLQKWGCLSQDYDAICRQALEEMQQSDFHVIWNLLTVWGMSS